MRRILFVCTGNTCRSPIAEAIARAAIAAGDLPLEVGSAGLSAIDGEPANEKAVSVLAAQGIDLSRHRSSTLTAALVEQYDLVLTMTSAQKEALIKAFPEAAGKTFTLKERSRTVAPDSGEPAEESDIEDPFGGGIEEYERAAREIRAAVEALLAGWQPTGGDKPSQAAPPAEPEGGGGPPS